MAKKKVCLFRLISKKKFPIMCVSGTSKLKEYSETLLQIVEYRKVYFILHFYKQRLFTLPLFVYDPGCGHHLEFSTPVDINISLFSQCIFNDITFNVKVQMLRFVNQNVLFILSKTFISYIALLREKKKFSPEEPIPLQHW